MHSEMGRVGTKLNRYMCNNYRKLHIYTVTKAVVIIFPITPVQTNITNQCGRGVEAKTRQFKTQDRSSRYQDQRLKRKQTECTGNEQTNSQRSATHKL